MAELNEFTPHFLEGLAKQLKNQVIPLPHLTVTDAIQPGLRAMIRSSGVIAFHCSYAIKGDQGKKERPYTKIGEFPAMSIPEARKLCKSIIEIAKATGVDPFADLLEARIREIKKHGVNFRP